MDALNVSLEKILVGKRRRFVPEAIKRVVVVDDNAHSAQLVASLLRGMGHVVVTAPDARTGMDICRSQRVELVLLDIMLPDLDGYEVARLLRQEHGAGLRIVALSGLAGEEVHQRCLEAGFDYHLLKPVDPAFLKSLLG
jgi:CheY-like chemotaxis protein